MAAKTKEKHNIWKQCHRKFKLQTKRLGGNFVNVYGSGGDGIFSPLSIEQFKKLKMAFRMAAHIWQK